MKNREIERKWLFNWDKVPKELSKTITYYEQSYLSTEPEVRIRQKCVKNLEDNWLSPTTYMLCLKGDGNLTRIEVQKPLTLDEYTDLKNLGNITDSSVIKKYYVTIPVNGYELTVGMVDECTPSEFCYGEIEFSTEEEAKAFTPPDWFGEDVTNDSSYKMKNYWKRTRLR